jgi:predicted class III extradiol MEMO1 family dioxygenase
VNREEEEEEEEEVKDRGGSYRSHSRIVQLPMIHRLTMNTIRTVPGQMVIRVFRTNLFAVIMINV